MSGLQRLFLRITPIIMLICFVCLGISHAFQQEGQPNITYLTTEIITLDDNNTETTEDDITITNYKFDFRSYTQNIDNDILKRATENVFNIDDYNKNVAVFNLIWNDGYDFGDGIQTIVNAVILVINSLLTLFNILLTPIRITAGIIITALSILGIDVTKNQNKPLIYTLHGILDNLNIKLMKPTYNEIYHTELKYTTWIWNNTIDCRNDIDSDENSIVINIEFEAIDHANFYGIIWNYNQTGDIYYIYKENNENHEIKVYEYGTGWLYQNVKQITITSTAITNEYDIATMVTILRAYATEIIQ